VSRIAAMAEKYRGGNLAATGSPGRLAGIAEQSVADYRQAMDALAIERGVAVVFQIVDAANEFIASTEPWAIARDTARAGELSQVLFDVAEALRVAAILLLPVMPQSAAEILRRVGEIRPAGDLRLAEAAWNNAGTRQILKGDALWPRAESDAQKAAKTEKVAKTNVKAQSIKRSSVVEESRNTPPAPPAPAAPAAAPGTGVADKISIDDFMKVDLRVAKVLTAEKVPNSRKLVKLSIDVGTEQRTLVAGISEAYEPEQLVGRTIVMVFNLKPAKLMGIESNGMVLAASPDGGKPTLVGFDQEIPPGTRVR
jgi:methionyl-tRNA synthetase